MADNSDAPTMQKQDVIQGARAIGSNPALLAALMSPPIEPDMATHYSPPGAGRRRWRKEQGSGCRAGESSACYRSDASHAPR